MIRFVMSKNYLHNYNISKTSVSNDELVKNNYKKNPINVDINKLLEQSKARRKKQKKTKTHLFWYSFCWSSVDGNIYIFCKLDYF